MQKRTLVVNLFDCPCANYSGLRGELSSAVGRVPGSCLVNGWACGGRTLGGRLSADDEMGRNLGAGGGEFQCVKGVVMFVSKCCPGLFSTVGSEPVLPHYRSDLGQINELWYCRIAGLIIYVDDSRFPSCRWS